MTKQEIELLITQGKLLETTTKQVLDLKEVTRLQFEMVQLLSKRIDALEYELRQLSYRNMSIGSPTPYLVPATHPNQTPWNIPTPITCKTS